MAHGAFRTLSPGPALNGGMEKVVSLSDYRKAKRPAEKPARAHDPLPHYFCQRCDTDHFKLYASGEVYCASCSALIRNILVSPTSPSSQGAGQ